MSKYVVRDHKSHLWKVMWTAHQHHIVWVAYEPFDVLLIFRYELNTKKTNTYACFEPLDEWSFQSPRLLFFPVLPFHISLCEKWAHEIGQSPHRCYTPHLPTVVELSALLNVESGRAFETQHVVIRSLSAPNPSLWYCNSTIIQVEVSSIIYQMQTLRNHHAQDPAQDPALSSPAPHLWSDPLPILDKAAWLLHRDAWVSPHWCW